MREPLSFLKKNARIVAHLSKSLTKTLFMKYKVGRSAIAGKGIFAAKDIKKGEFVFAILGEEREKINKTRRDSQAHPVWVGFEENKWIDPAYPYKFLNHSCFPTMAIVGKIGTIALRDIKEGEELTVDYSITEGDPFWKMGYRCQCGSESCRGIIRSIQYLDSKIFNLYFPYIAPSFQRIYYKHHNLLDKKPVVALDGYISFSSSKWRQMKTKQR